MGLRVDRSAFNRTSALVVRIRWMRKLLCAYRAASSKACSCARVCFLFMEPDFRRAAHARKFSDLSLALRPCAEVVDFNCHCDPCHTFGSVVRDQLKVRHCSRGDALSPTWFLTALLRLGVVMTLSRGIGFLSGRLPRVCVEVRWLCIGASIIRRVPIHSRASNAPRTLRDSLPRHALRLTESSG